MNANITYPRFSIGVTGIYATIENLEIKVSDLVAGSPADGSGLVAGDILTTVNGNTLAVVDPRVPLGEAITAAEGSDGQLVFGVQGKSDVTITIPAIGSYVTEWPSGNCPKSAQIVDDLAAFVVSNQLPDGTYDFAGAQKVDNLGACLTSLFLLSTGDDSLLPNVRLHAHTIAAQLVPSDTLSNWHIAYRGIMLAEYYLRTGDTTVLPALQTACDIVYERQLNGGWGHFQSMNPGYVDSGLMNSAGVPIMMMLILSKECEINVDDESYREALKLMYRMAGHGGVPYGQHRPELTPNTNGRNAMLACAFSLLDNPVSGNGPHYKSASEQLAMLVADSYYQPEAGHTGGGFNVVWRGLGSSHVPASEDVRRQRQMNELAWYYDLARKPEGGFTILPTPPSETRYSSYDLRWGCGAFGLTYTSTRKTLRITGAPKTAYSVGGPPPSFTWGNAKDREFLRIDHATGFVTEDDPDVVYDSLYGANKGSVTVAYCENYLKHYSPMVRWWAADRLKDINTPEAHTALANAVTHTDPRVRRAVYDALGGYQNWGRPFDTPIPSAEVSSTFLTSILGTLTDPNSAWWEIDGALFALANAEPSDIRANLATINSFSSSDEWWLREASFWAIAGLGSTITGPEFDLLSQIYANSKAVAERSSYYKGFQSVLNSGHDAFRFGQRAKSVRVLSDSFTNAATGYHSWTLPFYEERYRDEAASRAMALLNDYDPIVYRFIVDDIAEYLKTWKPGYQNADWIMVGHPLFIGVLAILDNHVGAYGHPIVEQLDRILAEYDTYPGGTADQKLAIQTSVTNWKATHDPYASPILPDASASLTAFYDFEGDYEDAPGAGIATDHLTNNGTSLSSDVPNNGSFWSANFDGASSLYTDAFSTDLGPDESSYTIMFWIKSADEEQASSDTPVLTTKVKPSSAGGGSATEPAWESGGFGAGDTDGLSVGFGGGGEAQSADWQSPSARGALSDLIADKNWHHVAFVISNAGHPDYSGDAYGRTYVDGVEVGTLSMNDPWTDHPLGNTEGMLLIGADNPSSITNGFVGMLDDLALFSGVVSDVDIAAIAAGSQSPSDPLQGPPSPNGLGPILSTPTVVSVEAGGASLRSDIQQASGRVTLVWAHTDQGASDLTTWQTASGGGSMTIGNISAGTSFINTISGLDGNMAYSFRFYAENDNGESWSDAGSFTTLEVSHGDTLKIFLLLGESNMEGQAYTYNSASTDSLNIPTLEFLASNSQTATSYLSNLPFDFVGSFDSTWLNPRSDAWCVHYDSGLAAPRNVLTTSNAADTYSGLGPLSPGFGAETSSGSMFGPELGMGQHLADLTGNPIMIFKSSKDATTLASDWRSPNAVSQRGGSVGLHYTNTINMLTSYLDGLDSDLADDGRLNSYNNAVDYEICGVFWLQGHSDLTDGQTYTSAQMVTEYDENLVDLIRSIRSSDTRIPADLPIIIGESSDQNTDLNTARQGAISILNTEIPNSAVYFDTDGMIGADYGNNENGVPFTQDFADHFHARAENFLEIGWKAGTAAVSNGYLGPIQGFYLSTPVTESITYNSASLSTRIGGNADTIKLVWDTVADHGGSDLSAWPNAMDIPSWSGGEGEISTILNGLTEFTTYYVRIHASDSATGNSTWSPVLRFTTPYQFSIPVLAAPTVTSTTSYSASLSCDLITGPATTVHLVWSSTDLGDASPATWASSSRGGSMTLPAANTGDTLTATINGLVPSSSYVVRFIASNPRDSIYSSPVQFATDSLPDGPPVFGAPTLSSTTSDSASLSCDLYLGPTTSLYAVWSSSDQGESDLATWTSSTNGGSISLSSANSGDQIQALIAGLDSYTKYVVRFVGTNSFGTSWSSPIELVTDRTPEGIALTAWYDFEPDGNPYDDPAGFYADDLIGRLFNPQLATDISPNAKGSTRSAQFDGFTVLHTDAYSPDLGPDENAMTVMFWIKGEDINQEFDNTRLMTTRYLPDGSLSNGGGWQIEGFGNNGSNGGQVYMGIAHPTDNLVFSTPAANQNGIGALANSGQEATWRHVTFVLANSGDDSGNSAYSQTYLDGVLVDQRQASVAWNGFNISNPDGQLIIGGNTERAYGRSFTGHLDDLAVFAGAVPSEIIQNIASGQSSPTEYSNYSRPLLGNPALIATTPTGATLNCNLIHGPATTVDIVWSSTDQGETDPASWASSHNGGFMSLPPADTGDNIEAIVSGLLPSSNYVMRFIASNPTGATWSQQIQVTTPPEAPSFGVPTLTSATPDGESLTVNCQLISGTADTLHVVWSTTDQGESDPGTWASSSGGGSMSLPAANTGDHFQAIISGLIPSTSYVIRFVGTNVTGTSWSQAIQLTTESAAPVFGEPTLTSVTPDSGSLSCDLIHGPADTLHVVWSATDLGEADPSTWASSTNGGSLSLPSANTGDIITQTITGLNPSTIYIARFIATNTNGTTWSTPVSFMTTRLANSFALTAYYDFEPDGDPYNDPAGFYADDLVGRQYNPQLAADISTNAKGSTRSAQFDGNTVLFTEAYTPDQGPDPNAMTIMFWVKGEDINQAESSTRLMSTRFKPSTSVFQPNGSPSSGAAWQIEGFGNDGTNGGDMYLTAYNPTHNVAFGSPAAMQGEIGALANTGQAVVWHHVAYVWSNSGGSPGDGAYSQTYLDGVSVGYDLEAAEWTGYDISNQDGHLIIGSAKKDATRRTFTGLLDDVALFAGVVPESIIQDIASGQISPAEYTDATGPVSTQAPILENPMLASRTHLGATLNCDLTSIHSSTAHVVWSSVDQGETDIDSWASSTNGGAMLLSSSTTTTNLEAIISGLASSTDYVVRFVSTNFVGTAWSQPVQLTTLPYSIESITRFSPANAITDSDSLTFLITFSKPVVNVSPEDFVVTGSTANLQSIQSTGVATYEAVISGGDLTESDSPVVGINLSPTQDIVSADNGTPLPADGILSAETYAMQNGPVVSIITPVIPATFNCITWPALISADVTDVSGVTNVDFSLRDTSTALYWSGTAWDSVGPVYFPATFDSTNWNLSFPAENLLLSQIEVHYRATDTLGIVSVGNTNDSFIYEHYDPGADILVGGETLEPNGHMYSPDGGYYLVMQTDGNLVIYQTGGGPIWATNTWQTDAYRTILSHNGTIHLENAAGDIIHTVYTSTATGNICPQLRMENDGRAVLYGIHPDGSYNKLWESTADSTLPTVSISEVTPEIRTTDAGIITISFSELVTNFDVSELSLTLEGSPISIPTEALTTMDQRSFNLDLSALTSAEGEYLLTINQGDIADSQGLALAAGASEGFTVISDYEQWIDSFYPGNNDPSVIGMTADPNGDRITNAVAFVLDASPLVYEADKLPQFTRGNGSFVFEYRRRADSADLDVYAEFTEDLQSWTRANDGHQGISITTDQDFYGAGIDRVSVIIPDPGIQRFMARLVVTTP